nr:hypothetical protein [Deltaproteobacteria bacterium]
MTGTFTHRTVSGGASCTGTEGEAAVEGSVDLGAVLKASIGKDDVLGASLAGSFKADGAITGTGKYEEDSLHFTLQVSAKEGR